MIASIPSPPNDYLVLGPLHLRYYGLMIALGVIVGVWIARRQLSKKGADPELIVDVAMWAVPAGLIGARIYHVITDYERTYCGPANGCPKSLLWDSFKIWEGGLGIPGGIAGGFLVGVLYCRLRKLDTRLLMDVVAPAIPISQAIGRLGNYFNQELFGRPTSLPWGLRITKPSALSAAQSVYPGATVFQPTFLYEGLWNVAVMGVVLLADKKLRLKRGKLFPLFISGYFLGRMWVEELRSDSAARVGDLRWNFVLAIIMVLVGIVWFFWGGCRATDDEVEAYAAQAAAGPPPPRQPKSKAKASNSDEPTSEETSSENTDELVAESGPELNGPVTEGGVAEADSGDAAFGIDPTEGSGGTEVPECSS